MSELRRYLASSSLKQLHKRNRTDWEPLAVFNLDVIGRSIVTSGLYERNVLNCLSQELFSKMKSKRIALDIGANIGNHSVFFSNHFSQVISFEPNQRTYLLLLANSMLKENIAVHNLGCSDREFSTAVNYSPENVGMASLCRNEGSMKSEFKLVRLDDFINKDIWGKIDFIKIDIEGHEIEALKGASNLIKANYPIIAFEVVDGSNHDGALPLMATLRDLGYDNFSGMADQTPLAKTSKKLAKLVNLLSIILTANNRKRFKLEPIRDKLQKNHDRHLVLASKGSIT